MDIPFERGDELYIIRSLTKERYKIFVNDFGGLDLRRC
jgi:hypothetical protein